MGYNNKMNTCIGWFTILTIIINFYFLLFGCIMNYTTHNTTSSNKKTKSTTYTTSSIIKRRKKYGNISIVLSYIGFIIIFLGEFGLIGTNNILYSSNNVVDDNTQQRRYGMQWILYDWIWNTFSPCVIGTIVISTIL